MKNYLVSFHPLCSTPYGRVAVQKHHLPPFIDGSCRREPDLESGYPSISALCRAGSFAPWLEKGDRVFYMTVKGWYGGVQGWAMVAALEVIDVAQNHQAASAWYSDKGKPVPSNCMVRGNDCKPLDQTLGLPGNTDGPWKVWGAAVRDAPSLEAWDEAYRRRAKEHPKFVITRALVPSRIDDPKVVDKQTLCRALGAVRVPGTQRCKRLSDEQFQALRQFL